MKVIAKASVSKYICEVSDTELEKFFNQYYGKMKPLSVGEEVNLGLGYEFSQKIEAACRQMAEAMESFDRAKKVMTDYALAVASRSTEGGAA